MNEEAKELHEPAPVYRGQISAWIVLYRRGTGEITSIILQSPDAVGALVNGTTGSCEIPGAGLTSPMEGLAYAATHYVDERAFFPQIRQRLACPAGVEGTVLRNLPLPCRIEISAPLGGLITHDEGEQSEVDLSFDHPGTYAVRVTSSRHMPGDFTVTKEG